MSFLPLLLQAISVDTSTCQCQEDWHDHVYLISSSFCKFSRTSLFNLFVD